MAPRKTPRNKLNQKENSDFNSNEVYEVELIVAKRENKENCKTEYKVRWKGFLNLDENTWEPEENILTKELIEEFHEREAKFDNLNLTDLTAEEIKILQECNQKREKQEKKARERRNINQKRFCLKNLKEKNRVKRAKVRVDRARARSVPRETVKEKSTDQKPSISKSTLCLTSAGRVPKHNRLNDFKEQVKRNALAFWSVPTRSGRVPKPNLKYINPILFFNNLKI